MKLLIATHNLNKFKEFKVLLQDFNFTLVSLRDLNINDEVAENENSYLGNAELKAKYYAALTNFVTLSDDSGLEIKSLNDLPGIYSARFLGAKKSYQEKNKIILHHLKDSSDRAAKYVCAISIAKPNQDVKTVIAELNGEISLEAKGEHGFGYDPIFKASGQNQTMAELSESQKNKISHRALAVKEIAPYLKELSHD
jgi:XTP/dITP diphosphohydrolase